MPLLRLALLPLLPCWVEKPHTHTKLPPLSAPPPTTPLSIDEAEYEDPDKISQQPLGFEGINAAVPLFVLSWVTTYTLCHG